MEANPSQLEPPPPSALCRLLRQIKRVLLLAVVVGLILVAGKYYWFDQLNEEIRARFERQLREHYPQLTVRVRSARRVAGQGVEIRGVTIAEAGPAARTLVEIDEIVAECDTRLPDFLTRQPHLRSVQIQRLKFRAERTAGEQWNLSQLLPLPSCSGGALPATVVREASLELVDGTQTPPCTWTLRNINLSLAPAAHAQSASRRVLKLSGSTAGDYLEQIKFSGTLDPQSGSWQIEGEVAGLEFSPRLRAALPRELSDSLAPLSSIRGQTHFQFEVSRADPARLSSASEVEAAAVRFLVHGQIADGRIDDARLPEPLTDVAAHLQCDNQGVTIEQLSARCGRTQIALNARKQGYAAGSPFQAELSIKQLTLERLNVASLPAELQQVWERFSPRGTVDLDGKLAFDGTRLTPDLTVRCHDLSMLYDKYPYRVTEGTGSIVVQPDFVVVRLRAIGGGGRTIQCRAEVHQPGPNFVGWIEVQSEGPLPIEDRLIAALDPQAQKIVRAFHPRGAVSFRGRLERDPDDAVCHRKFSVQLHDCSIQHDSFPYPIDKVTGTLDLTDDNWLFRNLAGRNDSAYIVGDGSWDDAPAGGMSPGDGSGPRVLRLRFTATDVPLADELRQAVSPEAQRLWANLRPRGNIDHLTVGLTYDGAQTSLEVNAEKWPPGQNVEGRSLSIEPTWFRYRFDNLTGNFRYRDGVTQLTNLQAQNGRTSIATEGLCRVLPDGSSRLELSKLSADRIEINDELRAALPSQLGQALSRVSEGALNLLGQVGMTIPASQDAAPAIDWNLSLDVENGRIATVLPIEHVHGAIRLLGNQGPRGVANWGELEIDSAMVRDVQLTNIQGPFWTDGLRLVFGPAALVSKQGEHPRQVSAEAFGGQLNAEGELALGGDGAFRVVTALENANLVELARSLSPQQGGLSGRVFGVANITGTSAGRHTWRGKGQVRLRDADIYEVPVMIALLKLLSVQRPDRTGFTTSEIDFSIEGDELALERIDFSGDAVSLKGEGRVNLERQISLKFYPVMGREDRQIPIFRPLLGETGRQFMLIQVTGTMDEPQVERTMLPKLDDRLRELFPELASEELVEPAMPIITAPREAINRLRLLPRR